MSSENQDKENKTKVGIYICHCGGNISDHVDVEELANQVKDLPDVAVTHTNMFMCSDPGQELIMEDIKSGKVNKIVVASCAPSLHELTFRSAIKRAGLNPYIYEHANIREQVSWVHHGEPATRKATALVAAAVAKSKLLKPLEPIRVDAKKHAVVIGGGVAGLRAARDIADLGIEVAIIEKSPFLGGQTAVLDELAPDNEKAGDLLENMAGQILNDPLIKVYTCCEIVSSEGYVGNFKVNVRKNPPKSQNDVKKLDLYEKSGNKYGKFVPFAGICPEKAPSQAEEFTIETGSIVFATGFTPYTPKKGEYGYGEFPQVITLPELIRLMAQNGKNSGTLEINGKKIQRLAFIHCVGSRQIPGIHEPDADDNLNEYCSRVCCSTTLSAANRIRERFPETHVFDFYRDIRTYGRGQEEYYDRASNNNVIFFRFEPEDPPVVEAGDNGFPLKITVKDTLTFGEELETGVDLVVLAVGMEPAKITELVDMMKLPVGADRFLLEVHPKLRPVELANTGLFLAGTCQAPMDIGETCSAAQAASAKVAALLSKGYVELDPFVARVDPEKCKAHGKCAGVCPEDGAIETDDNGKAKVNPALCTGCGICVGACPENAIDVDGWTLSQYEAMVDAIVSM